MRKSTSKAFSLVELSIVILIIGILIAGITQSSRLVAQMKLNTARTVTQSSPVASIKNLSLWLETSTVDSFLDSETADATNLSTWYDINPQASQKLTGTVNVASSDITYKANGINGLPTVNFKVGASVATRRIALSAVPAVSNSASTVFVVYRDYSASVSTQRAVFWNGSTTSIGWGYYKTVTDGYRRIATSTSVGETGTAMGSGPEIASMTISGSAGTAALYINGASISLSDGTLASFTASDGFIIGNYTNGTYATPWEGHISEIIMYDGVLKTEDRKSVESYLGKKYGIKVS